MFLCLAPSPVLGPPMSEKKEIYDRYTVEIGFREKIYGGIPKENGVTTFKSDAKGFYIEERLIRAMLREAAQTTGLLSKYGMRDLLAHGMFTGPDKIHLLRGNDNIIEEDGTTVACGAGTEITEEDALKRHMYVERPRISFTMFVTKVSPQAIDEEVLHTLFQVAQEIGLGADRSQGEGKFDLTKFERLT